MIITKLMGGLGNQMFQYAFGKMLSLKRNVPLKLDLTFLNDRSYKENFTYRNYALNIFNIKQSFASENELIPFLKNKNKKVVNLITLFFPFVHHHLYLKEPHFNFFPMALNASGNTLIDGYWQSEKYFKNISDVLRREFTLKNKISGQSSEISIRIKNSNSVSIHFRRGDYQNNPHISKYHGVCDLDYYYRAVNLMSSKIADPKYYIFSDEPQWAMENFKINFPVEFVTHNSVNNNYEDMLLMADCRHNIIANSSFSWWGSWLNSHKDKIVIAPSRWFNDPKKNITDLLPDTWLKI